MSTCPARDHRSKCIASLHVLVACRGAVQLLFPGHGGVYFLLGLFMATAVTMWAVLDSPTRNHPMIHIVQFLFLISWPIAAPVYLIRTRGMRGLGLAVIHALCLYATTYVFFYVTFGVLYSAGYSLADG